MRAGGDRLDSLMYVAMMMTEPLGIFVIILGISICLSVALLILKVEGKQSGKTVGHVYDVSCIPGEDGDRRCSVAYDFLVDGRSYSNRIQTSLSYREGDPLDVAYNKADPNDSSVIGIDWGRFAWLLISMCGFWLLAHITYMTRSASEQYL